MSGRASGRKNGQKKKKKPNTKKKPITGVYNRLHSFFIIFLDILFLDVRTFLIIRKREENMFCLKLMIIN